MRLLVQSAMIFFGTLLAAGLVALGEPQGGVEHALLPVLQGPWLEAAVAAAGR